jgi:hypothetical protein
MYVTTIQSFEAQLSTRTNFTFKSHLHPNSIMLRDCHQQERHCCYLHHHSPSRQPRKSFLHQSSKLYSMESINVVDICERTKNSSCCRICVLLFFFDKGCRCYRRISEQRAIVSPTASLNRWPQCTSCCVSKGDPTSHSTRNTRDLLPSSFAHVGSCC